MGDVTLKLSEDAVRAATENAIAALLSPEAAQQVIHEAIKSILGPVKPWQQNSPLQTAFEEAVAAVAKQKAFEMVETDEGFKRQIAELLRSTAAKMLAKSSEKLAERMADAFMQSLRY